MARDRTSDGRKHTIFALDIRVGDVVLDVNDSDLGDGTTAPKVEYVGDWCRGPDDVFGARVGFKDGTHTELHPTDVVVIRRRKR
jgi:hypothetical protein